MASLLYRLGRRFFRARRIVGLVWLAILLAAGTGALTLNHGTDNSFSIPGTESTAALSQLSRTFPQVSGASASVVVVAPPGQQVTDPAIRTAVGDAVTALGKIPHVVAAADPFSATTGNRVSADSSALIISAQLDGDATSVTAATRADLTAASDALRHALPAGSQVALGGQAMSQNLPTVSTTEATGLLVALVVLLITFGSLRAAGMPLLTALVGVAITISGVFVATSVTTISSTTPLLALMLGLAVGIDYALFIISRHRDQLRDGMDAEESAARALATAGSAVVFAGLTVIIALVGLSVANIPFLTTMGIAAACGVAVAVLIALTLVPALLGFAGEALRPGRRRARRRSTPVVEPVDTAASAVPASEASTGSTTGSPRPSPATRFFRGWVRGATRFPALTLIVGLIVIGLVALPALSLKLALPDDGTKPLSTGSRQAYDLIDQHFGPGYNAPLIVTGTIIGSTDPLGLMANLKKDIEALPGVAAVPLATPNQNADTGILQVIPQGGPNSQATTDLVAELRAQHDVFLAKYGVDLAVTGQAAVAIDVSNRLGGALLPFGILVVGLSLVLLTMVFRSIWVPVTAAIGFLLTIGASFGVVSMVFEYGWGAQYLHVDKLGPVLSFMPIVVMGVLFGLAMDYEVFLVSRIREEYVHRGNAHRAIETGFVASARVVTAAAVIMFAVFAAFVPEGDVNIKPIALGLAVGVFVDAFVVRMTLMPAILKLLGDRAWRMPRALDRLLPSFDVEGEGLARELELAEWPTAAGAAIAAEGLAVDGVFSGVDARVEPGGLLAVSGGDAAARAGLAHVLTARLAPDAGQLVVDGLAAPMRAADIRARSALLLPGGTADPVGDLRRALRDRPDLVVIDGIDEAGEVVRERLVLALTRELARRAGTRSPLTAAVTASDPTALADLTAAGGVVPLALGGRSDLTNTDLTKVN